MRARDNPFRSERVLSLRYRLGGSWHELLARFEREGRRAAIVGPHGSGKTTLMEDLAPRLREAGFTLRPLRLDTETPRFEPGFLDRFFASIVPGDVILFDGAEQLGAVAWHRFERQSRAAAGLLVTTHRPGRLPTLIETSTTPELLETLVAQILGEAASELRPLMPGLFDRHRGNLRDVLRELYDRFAAVEG
jgi:hypothetical protein